MSDLATYRVSIVTWDVFDLWIEAENVTSAESRARDLWSNGDRDHFSHRDGGIEYVEAEEEPP